MTRGFVFALYFTDAGTGFSLRVDADYAQEAARGWTVVDDPSIPVLGRGFLPRVVFGLDESGRRQTAIVATTDSDLWTGAVSTFVINGTDQLPHTVTVTGRLQERLKPSPG